MNTNVQIKYHTPRYDRLRWGEIKPEHPGDAGFDLRAAIDNPMVVHPNEWTLVATGISVAIERGFEAQIRPRSGLSAKHGISVLNSPGTIDADYRGEIAVIIHNQGFQRFTIKPGDRIAQMVICPLPTVTLTHLKKDQKLPDSERGEGGFGSTGTS